MFSCHWFLSLQFFFVSHLSFWAVSWQAVIKPFSGSCRNCPFLTVCWKETNVYLNHCVYSIQPFFTNLKSYSRNMILGMLRLCIVCSVYIITQSCLVGCTTWFYLFECLSSQGSNEKISILRLRVCFFPTFFILQL